MIDGPRATYSTIHQIDERRRKIVAWAMNNRNSQETLQETEPIDSSNNLFGIVSHGVEKLHHATGLF